MTMDTTPDTGPPKRHPFLPWLPETWRPRSPEDRYTVLYRTFPGSLLVEGMGDEDLRRIARDQTRWIDTPNVVAAGGILPVPVKSLFLLRSGFPVAFARDGVARALSAAHQAPHNLEHLTDPPNLFPQLDEATGAVYRQATQRVNDAAWVSVYFTPVVNALNAIEARELAAKIEPMAPIDIIAALALVMSDPTILPPGSPATFVCGGTTWDSSKELLPTLRRVANGRLQLGTVHRTTQDDSGQTYVHAFLLGGERSEPEPKPVP